MSDDDFVFSPEDDTSVEAPTGKRWPVLVVDDEPSVHDVTRLLLKNFQHDGCGLELLHAYSGTEARELLADRTDIAVILLDVVMETDQAGLDAARHIRDVLENDSVQIVVRSGQPGLEKESNIINDYGVDDYRSKTELTADRMASVLHSALSHYQRVTQLEESNQTLEQFAYIASHDLKQPVRQISNYSHLLSRAMDRGNADDEQSRAYLDFIIGGVQSISQLIDDLLELSIAGKKDSVKTQFELDAALDQALSHLESLITKRSVTIERQSLPSFYGNARYITQLLQNLIENAIKYNPGGAVHIRISAENHPKALLLRVCDNGPGLPQPLDQLYQPFKRGSGSDQVEGHGLGLAVCKRVIDFHDGEFRWESADTGGCFVISLPRAGSDAT